MDELGRFLSEHEFDFVNPKYDYEWEKYKDDVEEIANTKTMIPQR